MDDYVMSALRTPLWRATYDGYRNIVRLLLQFSADASKVATAAYNFSTPLGIACSMPGRLEIARMLLEARANADEICGENGLTPVEVAARSGNDEIVKLVSRLAVAPARNSWMVRDAAPPALAAAAPARRTFSQRLREIREAK